MPGTKKASPESLEISGFRVLSCLFLLADKSVLYAVFEGDGPNFAVQLSDPGVPVGQLLEIYRE